MYDPENFSERHFIYSAPTSDRIRSRQVGRAFRNGTESHFEIRLNIMPKVQFYLVPNYREGPAYRIYSGKWRSERGSLKFYRDVGVGNLSHDGDYIVLEFPELNQCFYMQIEPLDIHYWANQSSVA